MAAARIDSYVAMGDSFSAGAGCPPGARWTDRLARSLNGGVLRYANLASDGATSAEVMAQLGPALQREPDLVTLICGVNDVLHSTRPDIDGYAERLGEMFERLSSPRTLLVTATAPERLHFLGLGPRSERRVRDGLRALNEQTRRLAAEHGVSCLEVSGHPGLDEPSNFQPDGLHPSVLGHARAAASFAALIENASLTTARGVMR